MADLPKIEVSVECSLYARAKTAEKAVSALAYDWSRPSSEAIAELERIQGLIETMIEIRKSYQDMRVPGGGSRCQ